MRSVWRLHVNRNGLCARGCKRTARLALSRGRTCVGVRRGDGAIEVRHHLQLVEAPGHDATDFLLQSSGVLHQDPLRHPTATGTHAQHASLQLQTLRSYTRGSLAPYVQAVQRRA
jgi:hypothetical protein